MVDSYRASVSKVKSEWLSLFFRHRPLWWLSSLSEHTADFLAILFRANGLVSHSHAWNRTTAMTLHESRLGASANNDLEERGWFGFGLAASIQLSDSSCSFPSPDPQIQRLNISNPALHRQQGCKNESRRRVALLRRDRRRARVASP